MVGGFALVYVEATAAAQGLQLGVSSLSNGGNSLVQKAAQSTPVNWWANGGAFIASSAGAITV